MRLQWLAGIVALLVLAGNVAAALPRARELLTNIPSPLSNVDVAYTFPNFAQESQIIVGEDVTTVITVRNDGASPVNVKYITGSINSAKAYSIFLHNFTTTAYGSKIPKDGEQSFEYKFATAANMPPRQFRLALTVFYEGDKSQQYARTFFNSTVEVMEPERLIDTDALFLYLTLASIAAAIGASPGPLLMPALSNAPVPSYNRNPAIGLNPRKCEDLEASATIRIAQQQEHDHLSKLV